MGPIRFVHRRHAAGGAYPLVGKGAGNLVAQVFLIAGLKLGHLLDGVGLGVRLAGRSVRPHDAKYARKQVHKWRRYKG